MLQLRKYVSTEIDVEFRTTHFDVKLLITPVVVPYCSASEKILAIPGENGWNVFHSIVLVTDLFLNQSRVQWQLKSQ